MSTSKSAVLRRGFEVLEHQLTVPADHPALRIVGIVPASTGSVADPTVDVARDHDDYLAHAEIASWSRRKAARRHASE